MTHLRDADAGRPVDVTRFFLRLARRLTAQDLERPQAAAAVIAARGAAGMTPEQFAAANGIDPTELAAAEAGELDWNQLPASISAALAATPGLDLNALDQDCG